MIQYRRGLLALSLAISSAFRLSAAGTVGVASTRGTMEVNSAPVRDTANIPDGASVQTDETPGQIQLQDGVRVTLGENTSAKVYSDHLQLLQGTAQLTAGRSYSVDALGYRIEGTSKELSALVACDQNRILVAAIQSPVSVSKGAEVLARVKPGSTYYLDPNAVGAGSAGKLAKGGLSTGAKWGIAAGAAGAGTAAAVGAHWAGGNASR
jgi:hypothetical protein